MSAADPHWRATQRRQLRDQRMALSAPARIAAASGLAVQLLPLIQQQPIVQVAGYWALDGELPLHVLQSRLPDRVVYCLPVLHANRDLRFAPWRAGDPIDANRYGIPEPRVASSSLLMPQDMQLVLLPLVGFDRHGNRLGMGGGWYDRSFAFRQREPSPPVLVGVGYAFQEADLGPTADWDVPLDFIATERELIDCRSIRAVHPE